MSVDRSVVEYVAGLAKLELDEDEREALAAQLVDILALIEQLQEVDVTGVPPTKHVIGKDNVTRADEPRPCLSQEQALEDAPSADEGHFVVPKVLPD